ncbi:MAG: T9SS C-terminal target domain-containing protein [Chitinophagia bacterium]|nr:T9SS C-terminal target domain-containing protein [Chitinophagia bacterium]
MKRYIPILFFALSLPMVESYAQNTKPQLPSNAQPTQTIKPTIPHPGQAEFIGFRNPPSEDLGFLPHVNRISENESEDPVALQQLKDRLNKTKFSVKPPLTSVAEKTTAPAAPILGTNFAGIYNGGGSTPLDNTIAISNAGYIVAMVNSVVTYYTTTGTATYTNNIYNLIGDATLTNDLCDPKVIYDNVADRFIMYVQVCDKVVSHSKVVLGFSKSNNPASGWYFYKLTGNPLNDGSWFDYPKLGVSNDELFVTGNLFRGSTFNQSVVYQIVKGPLFSGAATPTWQYYSGISGAFTLCPASYGMTGGYGPGIYLVSNLGAGGFGGGVVGLYDVTNNIASGSASLTTYNVATAGYSAPGSAAQQGTSWQLGTGDYRILDAFYLNGIVHYVFNKDVGGGWSGICYNRLTVSSLSNVNAELGNVGVSDLAFGALAASGDVPTDKSVIIAFNQSASTYYPRTCAAKCDGSMSFSPILNVKSGVGYIHYSFVTTGTERWGDYTGMCRKYNDNPASLWMAGMYGNTNHAWYQWIAKLNGPTNAIENVNAPASSAKVYPNPVTDFYAVEFDAPARQKLHIYITDMTGKTIADLYNNIVEEGENRFSFNKANLSPGIYLLHLVGENNFSKHEKITVLAN